MSLKEISFTRMRAAHVWKCVWQKGGVAKSWDRLSSVSSCIRDTRTQELKNHPHLLSLGRHSSNINVHWAKAHFFFDLCGCWMLTIHWILYNGMFPLPNSYADSYSDVMQKGSTGTESNGHSDVKLLWKLLKNPSYWYWYQCQIGYSTHLHRNKESE